MQSMTTYFDGPEKICYVCKRSEPRIELFRCSGCREVYYCGFQHQKSDWKSHKLECKTRALSALDCKRFQQPFPGNIPRDIDWDRLFMTPPTGNSPMESHLRNLMESASFPLTLLAGLEKLGVTRDTHQKSLEIHVIGAENRTEVLSMNPGVLWPSVAQSAVGKRMGSMSLNIVLVGPQITTDFYWPPQKAGNLSIAVRCRSEKYSQFRAGPYYTRPDATVFFHPGFYNADYDFTPELLHIVKEEIPCLCTTFRLQYLRSTAFKRDGKDIWDEKFYNQMAVQVMFLDAKMVFSGKAPYVSPSPVVKDDVALYNNAEWFGFKGGDVVRREELEEKMGYLVAKYDTNREKVLLNAARFFDRQVV